MRMSGRTNFLCVFVFVTRAATLSQDATHGVRVEIGNGEVFRLGPIGFGEGGPVRGVAEPDGNARARDDDLLGVGRDGGVDGGGGALRPRWYCEEL